MPYIDKTDWTPSTLAVTTMDMAALLDTYPAQICRWREDKLFKQVDGKYYEPIACIVALVNWRGRGRVPKPVTAWRELLGTKQNRRAFLDGMARAFNLVSEIMERQICYNPKFYSFAKFDPDYVAGGDEAEGGEDGPDDLQLSEADMDALTAMRESVDSAAAGAMLDDDGGEG